MSHFGHLSGPPAPAHALAPAIVPAALALEDPRVREVPAPMSAGSQRCQDTQHNGK